MAFKEPVFLSRSENMATLLSSKVQMRKCALFRYIYFVFVIDYYVLAHHTKIKENERMNERYDGNCEESG